MCDTNNKSKPIIEKAMFYICNILDAHGLSCQDDITDEIYNVVCASITEAMNSSGHEQLPYQIGMLQQTDAGFSWRLLATFGIKKNAEAYFSLLQTVNPHDCFALFESTPGGNFQHINR